MRPPQYYSNFPPPPGFNQFPPYGYQMPNYYGRMGPPQFPAPQPAPRFDSFMEAANKFISTYQSFQPIIAQATPMLRNLPALWKLYKGFQSIPTQPSPKNEDFFKETQPIRNEAPRHELPKGKSYPRIFQPPFID